VTRQEFQERWDTVTKDRYMADKSHARNSIPELIAVLNLLIMYGIGTTAYSYHGEHDILYLGEVPEAVMSEISDAVMIRLAELGVHYGSEGLATFC
jgi:hypothetical protein